MATKLGLIKLQSLLKEKKRREELARDALHQAPPLAAADGDEGLHQVPPLAAADGDVGLHQVPPLAAADGDEGLHQVPPLAAADGDATAEQQRGNQERVEAGRKANKSGEPIIPKKDLPEATPEAKRKAADANARGKEAFNRNDFAMAIDAYTQAIEFDPTDGTLFSNRSLCRIRLGQAEQALSDANACRELRPNWAKACYREGAALSLLQRFQEAANAFYDGIQIDPKDEMLLTAFKDAFDAAFGAGRQFHGTNTKN